MNRLYYAGKDLADFGVYFDSSKSFAKPQKRVNKVTVPGRSGDLIFSDGGYDNVIIEYRCFIKTAFKDNFEELINYLMSVEGYGVLSTTDHGDEYRHGSYYSATEPETGSWNKYAQFSLYFDCKPQIWYVVGNQAVEFTASGTINNPSKMVAHPIITVYGNGTVTINGTTITTAGLTDYVVVDCDIMDCYKGTTQMNDKVTFSTNDFPTLKSGSNIITFGTGVTKVSIVPKWWHL